MATTSRKILAVIIAVVVLLGATVAGVIVLNSPKLVAARALESMVTDFAKREEIKPWKDTLTGGSIAFSADSLKVDDEPLFENGKVSGKLYFGKEEFMLSDLELKYEDFKVSGDLYLSMDQIYVNESEFIGGAYGVNMETIADDLAKSIFAPDSGSEYALEEELYNKIIDALKAYKENDDLTDDAKKLVKDVMRDISKIVMKNAEVEADNVKERLNGETKKVRAITITLDDNAKKAIIKEVYDYLCDSEKITDFIEKYQDTFEPLLKDLYEDEYSSLLDAYKGILKDAEDTVDDMCESIDDSDPFVVKVFTPKHSAKFLKLEIIADKDSVLTIDCGEKGMRRTNMISVDIDGSEVVYEIKENSNKLIDVAITYKPYDGQRYELTLKIDKKSESYVAEFKDIWKGSIGTTNTDKWTVTGDISTKGDTTTFTVENITNKWEDGKSVIRLNCEITVDRKDKMPNPVSDYKTIADIKEETIEKWIEKFSELDF